MTDGDLAGVGFGDEDLHFLRVSGKVLEKAEVSEVERLLISREMERITGRQRDFKSASNSDNGPSPGRPGGGDEARHRAEQERDDFLRQFEAVVG